MVYNPELSQGAIGAIASRIGFIAFILCVIDSLLVKVSVNVLYGFATYLIFELLDGCLEFRDDLIILRVSLRLPVLMHLLLSLEVQFPLLQVLPVATLQLGRVGPLMLSADAT